MVPFDHDDGVLLVEAHVDGPTVRLGDLDLRNLLDDALAHAASRIELSVHLEDGTARGLAIARTLAERNGGDVELVDDAAGGSGAHFRLRLPGAGS